MTAAWNLLVYAVAHKPDELKRITDAIDEMCAALTSDQCNIAVQLHAPDHTTRYWLAAGQPVRTEPLPGVVDASRKATLTDFLDDVDHALPATSTALVLWAHGAALDDVHELPEGPGGGLSSRRDAALRAHSTTLGYDVLRIGGDLSQLPSMFDLPPVRGPESYGCKWGPDPNSGEFLTNVSMKQAISARKSGQQLDVLALNACWMGAIEVLYELRNAATILVACQVYARPWPYGEIASRMSKTPHATAEQLARQLVDIVRDGVRAKQRDDMLAAIRGGDALEQLAFELDKLIHRALQLIASSWDGVHDIVTKRVQRIDDINQADLMSVLNELAAVDGEAAKLAAPAVERLKHAVIDHTAGNPAHPNLHGLSIFCPTDTHIDLIDAYQGTDFRTHSWAKFLTTYQKRTTAS